MGKLVSVFYSNEKIGTEKVKNIKNQLKLVLSKIFMNLLEECTRHSVKEKIGNLSVAV